MEKETDFKDPKRYDEIYFNRLMSPLDSESGFSSRNFKLFKDRIQTALDLLRKGEIQSDFSLTELEVRLKELLEPEEQSLAEAIKDIFNSIFRK